MFTFKLPFVASFLNSKVKRIFVYLFRTLHVLLEIARLPLFGSFFHWMVFDLFFYCVTVKTIYTLETFCTLSFVCCVSCWRLHDFPYSVSFRHTLRACALPAVLVTSPGLLCNIKGDHLQLSTAHKSHKII